MGSNSSSVTPPTSSQIEEIKDIWAEIMQDPSATGSLILVNYFTKYPHELEKFKIFEGLPFEELKTKPIFKSHAKRIVNALNSVLDLAQQGRIEDLEAMLTQLGSKHIKMRATEQDFLNLKQIFYDTLSAHYPIEDHFDAWKAILEYSFGVIIEGNKHPS